MITQLTLSVFLALCAPLTDTKEIRDCRKALIVCYDTNGVLKTDRQRAEACARQFIAGPDWFRKAYYGRKISTEVE